MSGDGATIEESIKTADSVIVGTIESIESQKSVKGNTFSVLSFKNASSIGAFGAETLERDAKVYVWGGVLENPNYGRDRGSEKYILSVIGGAPSFNTGDSVILMLKGNGIQYLPFRSSVNGLLRIRKDNTLTDSDGGPIVYTGTKYISQPLQIDSGDDVQLIETSFEEPSVEQASAEQSPDYRPVFLEDMISYIANVRIGKPETFSNPSKLADMFHVK